MTGPVRSPHRKLAFVDPLPERRTLAVKSHHPVHAPRQIRDDEDDSRKQLARVPFQLGHDATESVRTLIPHLPFTYDTPAQEPLPPHPGRSEISLKPLTTVS